MSGKFLVIQTQAIVGNQQLMQKIQAMMFDTQDILASEISNGTLKIPTPIQNLISTINPPPSTSPNILQKNWIPSHSYEPILNHSPSDLQKIRQQIRKHKQYEEKLQTNAQHLENLVKEEQEDRRRREEEERQKFMEERRNRLFESIQEIRNRNLQRRNSSAQENACLSRVKTEKKLHELLAEKWKKEQEDEKKQKFQLMEKLNQQKKINFDQIRTHAIKHDEILMKIKQSRSVELNQSHSEHKKIYKSRFMNRVIQEDQKNREEQDIKRSLPQKLLQKKQQYGALVRQNHKPSQKQTPTISQQSQLRVSKSVSQIQLRNKGNNYMKQAHSRISINKSALQRKLTNDQQIKTQFFKYKNYLTEIRIKNNESQKMKSLTDRVDKHNVYEEEIRKILNQPTLSQEQKFIRAKLATKRLQNEINKKNPFNLIDSINAKIQILKHASK